MQFRWAEMTLCDACARREALTKVKWHKDEELFEKAYGYVQEYY